jgi:hypothetical protein
MGITKPNRNIKRSTDHISDYATARLQYWGVMNGYVAVNVGIGVEMDTSVGLKYEVTYSGGVTSHMAYYYKFSNPYQVMYYNFITRKSGVIKSSGSANGPDVSVMGNATINGYYCTHLHHQNDKGTATQDYWMCDTVPGFAQVARVLKSVDANLKFMVIDQSIFNWGGLVKLKMIEADQGLTTSFDLNLATAQAGIPIRVGAFDPPSH